MRSRTEQMTARLRDLRVSTPDIEASALVSVDGLIIADPGVFSLARRYAPRLSLHISTQAMSAAMLSLGERIAGELGRGMLDQVYIRGDNGYVILMSVGEEAVLTALARQDAKLGLVFLDMRRAASDLARLV